MHRSIASVLLAAIVLAFPAAAAWARAASPDDAPRCEDVKSIGSASMAPDGTLTVRLRSLPPGPIGEAQFTVKVGAKDYQDYVDHAGGLKPGETKGVRPWC